jgi:hypothetical protein
LGGSRCTFASLYNAPHYSFRAKMHKKFITEPKSHKCKVVSHGTCGHIIGKLMGMEWSLTFIKMRRHRFTNITSTSEII